MSRLKKWFGKEEKAPAEVAKQSQQSAPEEKRLSGLKSNTVKKIEADFYRYLISKSLLLPDEEEVDTEIPDDRILLDIELAPALARQAERQESKNLFNALKAQLYQDVESRVEERLLDIDKDTWQRFTINSNLMDGVNMLMTKAASISRLKLLIMKDTGLLRNLVSVLNRMGMSKKTSDKPLELKDAELCLGFLGVEKLRILLPYLIMHEAMKESGAKYNQMSRKLWNHAQITATAARALAAETELVNPEEAYIMAMFHEIGAVFLLHLVDESFQQTRRSVSNQAMESGAAEVSHQILEIKSAVPVLDRILPSKAKSLSVKIAAHYNMNFLTLAGTLEELSEMMSFDDLSPMARVISQARSYSVFKQLFKEDLIDKKQASMLLGYYQLDSKKIKLLNGIKYLKLPSLEV